MAVSAWETCLNVTQTIIRGLGLTWLPPGATVPVALPDQDVLIRDQESDENVHIPNIQVVPEGIERDEKGDYEDTETILSVKVVHTFEANQSFALSGDKLLWRQLIYDAFIDQPRPEVAAADATIEDCDVQVKFSAHVDKSKFDRQDLQVGAMLLEFRILRSRNRL